MGGWGNVSFSMRVKLGQSVVLLDSSLWGENSLIWNNVYRGVESVDFCVDIIYLDDS